MTALFYPPKFDSEFPGAKLTFTQTGTTTPQNTYQDEALTTPHANPVVADANGVFAPIFLDGALPSYRVKYTTSADVLIYQVDGYPSNANKVTSLRIQSATPELWFYDTDGTVNARKVRARVSGNTFDMSFVTDNEGTFSNFLSFDGTALTLLGGAPSFGSYAKKLNDSSITSSTVLTNDADLHVALESGYMYVLEEQVEFDAAAGQGAMGAKFAFNYSGVLNTGLKANISQFVNAAGAVAIGYISVASVLTYATIGDTANSNQIRFTQYLRATTLGTLTLQIAQNSSNVAALSIRQGSWIRVHRIGTSTS